MQRLIKGLHTFFFVSVPTLPMATPQNIFVISCIKSRTNCFRLQKRKATSSTITKDITTTTKKDDDKICNLLP